MHKLSEILLSAVIVVCVVATLMLVVMTSCSSPHVKNAEAAAIDCAKTDILTPLEESGMSALGTVAGIILTGSTTGASEQALAELKQLETKLTPAVVGCAAKAAAAVFAASPKPPAPTNPPAVAAGSSPGAVQGFEAPAAARRAGIAKRYLEDLASRGARFH